MMYTEHVRLTETVTRETCTPTEWGELWHTSATVYKFRSFNVDYWRMDYTVTELGETRTVYKVAGNLRSTMYGVIRSEDEALLYGLMLAHYRIMAIAKERQQCKAIVLYNAFQHPVTMRINALLLALGTDVTAYLNHVNLNTRRKANALHYLLLARDAANHW